MGEGWPKLDKELLRGAAEEALREDIIERRAYYAQLDAQPLNANGKGLFFSK